MKTVSWHLLYLTGSTVRLYLRTKTGAVNVNGLTGDAMTETTGMFAADVEENLSGWHKAYAVRNGVPVDEGWVNMSAAQPVVVPTIAATSTTQTVVGRYSDTEAESPNVRWKVREVNKMKTVSCVDVNGDPIDLGEFDLTNAYLAVESIHSKVDVQVIEIADITIGGDAGNELTFQVGSQVLDKPGNFLWAFRQEDESEIAHGRITVDYSPFRD